MDSLISADNLNQRKFIDYCHRLVTTSAVLNNCPIGQAPKRRAMIYKHGWVDKPDDCMSER